MVPERPVDPAALYEAERVAFLALLRSVTTEQLGRVVPATPAWTVHDVLAHLVGITADLNAQRFGGGDADAWTELQIEARRLSSIDELAAEWDREGPQFETGLRLFGYQFGAHYLGDLVLHVADVKIALGLPAERDDIVIAVALDFYLASLEESLQQIEAGAVEVRVGNECWRLGRGKTRSSLEADRFELLRALGGRRTLPQVAAMAWTGDSDAIVPLVSRYPAPAVPVEEPWPRR